MKKKLRLSYKFIIVCIFLLFILIIGTLVSMRVLLRDVQTANGYSEDIYTRHYAYIYNNDDPYFWNNAYEGALNKGNELGVYVEDFGDNLTATYSKDQLIEIATDASVDGIIIDGDSDEETIRLIHEAAAKGIPVVTLLDDCVGSERITYVGVSSYAMGRQYGEQISPHIKKDEISSIYVMMDTNRENSGQELVIAGISDVLTEAGYGDLFTIEGIYIDDDATFSAEEQIRDIFVKGNVPDVVVALSSIYTRCLFQAVVDLNMVGDVYIYGFNDSTDILEAVSKNIVEATLSVDAERMGASAVESLEEYLNTGYVSDYISEDSRIILSDDAQQILNEENEETE